MLPELAAHVARIHAAPQRMVMHFAGAGAQALAWLHAVGGSSRTVLEATDHYASRSLVEAVGFSPERFTAPEVAAALAARALARARALEPEHPVFGLGSSATVATDRDKRGEHRLVVSVCDALGSTHYALTLHKGARDRAGEEDLVSRVLLNAVAEACGLEPLPLPLLRSEGLESAFTPAPELAQLGAGEVGWLRVGPDGRLGSGDQWPGLVLLSGSFNPLHQGHRRLAEVAASRLGREVVFELSLENADKPPIALAEVRRRAQQFAGLGSLLLTRTPRFLDKAELFPASTFVMGADTAARLLEERFYGDPAALRSALEALRRRGVRLLVAGRAAGGGFRTLEDLAVPPPYRELFASIPAEVFQMDISSSELRERRRAPQL